VMRWYGRALEHILYRNFGMHSATGFSCRFGTGCANKRSRLCVHYVQRDVWLAVSGIRMSLTAASSILSCALEEPLLGSSSSTNKRSREVANVLVVTSLCNDCHSLTQGILLILMTVIGFV